MDQKIAAALIALTGVGISALLSWILAARKLRAEIERIRFDTQQNQAIELQKKRVDVYPHINETLNILIQEIQARNLNLGALNSHRAKLNEWYIVNSVFLSANSNAIIYRLLRYFHRITPETQSALNQRLADRDKRRYMINSAFELQLALKNDLGVFSVEFFDPEMKFKTYKEVGQYLSKIAVDEEEA